MPAWGRPWAGRRRRTCTAARGILFWTPERQIVGYRAIDDLYPTRQIEAGGHPYPLIPAERDFSTFRYRHDGVRRTLDEYMETQRVAGLIAVKDGKVAVERYGLGNDADSRWISFSIAKSVVSLLIGAAIQDGYIESVDDLVVDYLPRLKGGVYDAVTIRHILQMSSGVAWNEDYADPQSDTALAPGGGMALIDYMKALPRVAEPGVTFNYNTGETSIAGAVLRAAIGNNLATYLTHKIWRPFGMEADASWLIDAPGGHEYGGCCINATLRDYARIGLIALNGGVTPLRNRVVPEGWMRDSVAPSPGYDGYGYYWWLFGDGIYGGIGIFEPDDLDRPGPEHRHCPAWGMAESDRRGPAQPPGGLLRRLGRCAVRQRRKKKRQSTNER